MSSFDSPPPAYFELQDMRPPPRPHPRPHPRPPPVYTSSPSTITCIQGQRLPSYYDHGCGHNAAADVDAIDVLDLSGVGHSAGGASSSAGGGGDDIVRGFRVVGPGDDYDGCSSESDAVVTDGGDSSTTETETDDGDDSYSSDTGGQLGQAGGRRKKKKKKKKKKIYWIKHRVRPDDTLAGLCLRFDVEASMLKRLNRFTADHFWMKQYLVIPTTDPKLGRADDAVELTEEQQAARKAQKERQLETTLGRICPELTGAEARTYLKLYSNSIPKVLAALQQDREWEASGCPLRVPTVEDRTHPRFKR